MNGSLDLSNIGNGWNIGKFNLKYFIVFNNIKY